MTYKKWLETYKPIRTSDEEGDDSPANFACNDKDELAAAHKEKRVWSIVDAEGDFRICPGWRSVNVIDRLITEKSHEGLDPYDFYVKC